MPFQGLLQGIQTGVGIRHQGEQNRRANDQASIANQLSRFRLDEAKQASQDRNQQRADQQELRGLHSEKYSLGALRSQLQQRTASTEANAAAMGNDTQAALKQFGIDAEDPVQLQKQQVAITSVTNRMDSMRKRADAGEQIDEGEMADFSRAQIKMINDTFGNLVNQGAGPGERKKVRDIVKLPNGNYAIDIGVEGGQETGRTSFMTDNRSSAEDDPIMEISPQQFRETLNQAQMAIDQRLIALGDNSPIQAQAAQAQAQQEAGAATLAHNRDLEVQGVRNQGAMDLARFNQGAQTGRAREGDAAALNLQNTRDAASLKLQQSKDAAALARDELKIKADAANTKAKTASGSTGGKGDWNFKDFEKQAQSRVRDILRLDSDVANITADVQKQADNILAYMSKEASAAFDRGEQPSVHSIGQKAHKIFNASHPDPHSEEYLEALDQPGVGEALGYLKANPETLIDFVEKFGFRPYSRWNG